MVVESLVVVLIVKVNDPLYQLFCILVMAILALVKVVLLVILTYNTWVDCLIQVTANPVVVVLHPNPLFKLIYVGIVIMILEPE